MTASWAALHAALRADLDAQRDLGDVAASRLMACSAPIAASIARDQDDADDLVARLVLWALEDARWRSLARKPSPGAVRSAVRGKLHNIRFAMVRGEARLYLRHRAAFVVELRRLEEGDLEDPVQ